MKCAAHLRDKIEWEMKACATVRVRKWQHIALGEYKAKVYSSHALLELRTSEGKPAPYVLHQFAKPTRSCSPEC